MLLVKIPCHSVRVLLDRLTHGLLDALSACALADYIFCGEAIICCKSIVHLGHVLYFNLLDTADILQHSHLYIKQANDTLIRFGFCSPHL